MASLLKVWRWLITNVIDLWKGAFVATAGLQTLLVVAAWDQGLRRPFSWVLLLLALPLLPVTRYCYQRFAASYRGEAEPSLPPFDQLPVAEPPSHVRRVE